MRTWIQVKPGDPRYPGYFEDEEQGIIKKSVGDASDFRVEHGIAIHFAGGGVCKIAGVRVNDFEETVKNALALRTNETEHIFIRVKNGPMFQLSHVDFIEYIVM